MKNFKEFLISESNEENAIYYKVHKNKNGKIAAICLQWFDGHIKWVPDEVFHGTKDLWLYLHKNYDLDELDSELTNFKDFKQEYGGDSTSRIMKLVVNGKFLRKSFSNKIEYVRERYGILTEVEKNEVYNDETFEDEVVKKYIFTGFELELNSFISDNDLNEEQYEFVETDYFY